MPSFQYSLKAELFTNESPSAKLDKSISLAAGSAKEIHDDIHAAGSVDLAPLMASIDDPAALLIRCDGDGVKLKFAGVATFTAKAYKTVLLEVSPNAIATGVLDVELEAVGVGQRIRAFAIGVS